VNRVLVTGGSGFIGRNVLGPLVERGYEVHATARAGRDAVAGVRWHGCDLLDNVASGELVREIAPTHLLHLAWYAEHRKFWSSPLNVDWTSASLSLLRSFHRYGGRRVVMAGTCAEYQADVELCLENETPLTPTTLYGASKNAVRAVAERFAAVSQLSFAWGRVFFLYGPNENPARLIPSIARALVAGRHTECGPGHQKRDFLHSEDVASAFVALLDSEVEGAVNIGSGHAVTIKEVAEVLGNLAGRPDLIRLGDRPALPGDPAVLIPDVTRLVREVRWVPRWDLENGLADALRWWQLEMHPTAG